MEEAREMVGEVRWMLGADLQHERLYDEFSEDGRSINTSPSTEAFSSVVDLDLEKLTSGSRSDKSLVPSEATPSRGEMQPLQPLIEENETPWWRQLLETLPPFLCAGTGFILAGHVLGLVQAAVPPLDGIGLWNEALQDWDVFVHMSEIFILVPALLGLKGNLEMTLAARLSTQANLGHFDNRREQWKMIVGNLALTQAQAVAVGFLAAVFAMMLGWIPARKFNLDHAFLLCASSVLTASGASFLLGSLMVGVVIISRKCRVNPDNIATPIAASLGDLTTLALLTGISTLFWKFSESKHFWPAPTMLFLCMGLTPLWCYIAFRNDYVRSIVFSGLIPVIGAMVISSLGGLILDFAIRGFHSIAFFQPVVNGVGGNLAAIQASRLSTGLHKTGIPGNMQNNSSSRCPNPVRLLCGKGSESSTLRMLLALVLPGHLVFMYAIHYMEVGEMSVTPTFTAIYLTAAFLQVLVLLYLASWVVPLLWRYGYDPDNSSIPFLTAFGDLLGGALLISAFHILLQLRDPDVMPLSNHGNHTLTNHTAF